MNPLNVSVGDKVLYHLYLYEDGCSWSVGEVYSLSLGGLTIITGDLQNPFRARYWREVVPIPSNCTESQLTALKSILT